MSVFAWPEATTIKREGPRMLPQPCSLDLAFAVSNAMSASSTLSFLPSSTGYSTRRCEPSHLSISNRRTSILQVLALRIPPGGIHKLFPDLDGSGPSALTRSCVGELWSDIAISISMLNAVRERWNFCSDSAPASFPSPDPKRYTGADKTGGPLLSSTRSVKLHASRSQVLFGVCASRSRSP